MTLYLDTSATVALLTAERAAARVQARLRADLDEKLAISSWVVTETSSALSLKIRTGELTVETRADALTQWRGMREAGLAELSVDAECFEAAARFADHHHLGLRAGDALHLAVAAAHGCTLVTLDERMAKAALELGVPVAEI